MMSDLLSSNFRTLTTIRVVSPLSDDYLTKALDSLLEFEQRPPFASGLLLAEPGMMMLAAAACSNGTHTERSLKRPREPVYVKAPASDDPGLDAPATATSVAPAPEPAASPIPDAAEGSPQPPAADAPAIEEVNAQENFEEMPAAPVPLQLVPNQLGPLVYDPPMSASHLCLQRQPSEDLPNAPLEVHYFHHAVHAQPASAPAYGYPPPHHIQLSHGAYDPNRPPPHYVVPGLGGGGGGYMAGPPPPQQAYHYATPHGGYVPAHRMDYGYSPAHRMSAMPPHPHHGGIVGGSLLSPYAPPSPMHAPPQHAHMHAGPTPLHGGPMPHYGSGTIVPRYQPSHPCAWPLGGRQLSHYSEGTLYGSTVPLRPSGGAGPLPMQQVLAALTRAPASEAATDSNGLPAIRDGHVARKIRTSTRPKSQYVGISSRQDGKFKSVVVFQGQSLFIGAFSSEHEAVLHYDVVAAPLGKRVNDDARAKLLIEGFPRETRSIADAVHAIDHAAVRHLAKHVSSLFTMAYGPCAGAVK